jgi:hypothetical protein
MFIEVLLIAPVSGFPEVSDKASMMREVVSAVGLRRAVHGGILQMVLTTRRLASKIRNLCQCSDGMALSFLKDGNGGSPARAECQALLNSWPGETRSVLAHVAAAEAVGGITNNGPLAQAQDYPGPPYPPVGTGRLYWWEINRVGAFYAYDGKDMVVLLMDRVSNPPTFGDLLSRAQGRV